MTRRHHAGSLGLIALLLALSAAPALADPDCDVPAQRWQSRDAVRQLAARQGWQVQRLKIDDGCYEIRATDAEGRAFKARIDPETLQVLKRKWRDRDDDRRRHRESAAPQAPAVHPDAAASSPFTPGTAPRGQVE
ncbi:MAG: PepSY domain-containing protein [Burkholderiales bacterium]